MQYRVGTQTVTEEERRAIKYAMDGHRTPASREQCAEFAEQLIRERIDEVLVPYRKHMDVLNKARASKKKK